MISVSSVNLNSRSMDGAVSQTVLLALRPLALFAIQFVMLINTLSLTQQQAARNVMNSVPPVQLRQSAPAVKITTSITF